MHVTTSGGSGGAAGLGLGGIGTGAAGGSVGAGASSGGANHGGTNAGGAHSAGASSGGALSAGGNGGATAGTSASGGAAGGTSTSAFWERIGPWNFFNEASGNGPSGTCAEAVADPNEPLTLYVGGQNNSATTGVRRSTDGGKHWVNAVDGLTDRSIRALRLDPSSAQTLYAGTPSGVFKSSDGAATWSFESATQTYGEVRRLVATNVGGAPTLIAATAKGLAYRAFSGTSWASSAAPSGGVYDLVVASTTAASTTLYAALDSGAVYKVTMSGGAATWSATALSVNTLSVDPSNPDHILGTVHPGSGTGADYSIVESTDGGATSHSLNGSAVVFYIAFDPRDTTGKTVWTGAESGVGRSTDGGKTFKSVPWKVKSKDGYTADSSQTDVQRILVDFPGQTAFCTDQGLIQYDTATGALDSLSGDIHDSIVVSVATSRIDAMTTHVLTTMWDWGPTASWDGGQSWQATSWYGSAYWNGANGKGAPAMGEGGDVFAVGDASDGKNHVLLLDGATTLYSSDDGGLTFTSSKLPLSVPAHQGGFDWERDASGKASGVVYLVTGASGATSILRGTNYGQSFSNWGQASFGVVAAVVVDPKDATHVFVATGSCFTATSDGGSTWSACVTPSPSRAALKRLALRADDPTKLLALSAAGELLRSSDSGASWTAVTAANVGAALGGGGADSALLSYAPSGKLAVLVSTVTARPLVTAHVLSSADDGASWTDITNDLVATQFNDATWDGNDFYLASSGEAILRRRGLAL